MTSSLQDTGGRRLRARSVLKWLAAASVVVACASVATSASAAWYVNGVLVSNVCRAPSGASWIYPPYDAQPVGTNCAIPSTGEIGVVTPT